MKFCRLSPFTITVAVALALAGCSQNTGARVTTTTAYDEPLTLLTGSNGMTLYVFDKDEGGEPKCYAKCAVNWPPYIAAADETKPEIWQTVQRSDGKSQWTYDGKPVYFFKGDKAEGDTKGDGKDGVWHIIYRS